MCKPVTCPTCNQTTWFGCGLHIPRAMSEVPKLEWCTCVSFDGEKSEFPPKAGTGVQREESDKE